MSYLVLARKWRPQIFEDVVGQTPVVRTLKNALARNRVAHAMIFSGVRGVGKTTLARIMAKAMNCTGEGPPPCNSCESCLEITRGSAIDLHEIDGASNRGIQEIRELKENIRFFPVKGRYKIIIIDEVHMLTAEAFNALLKTLEEPPEHVFFMFATTELHKIPITILSRCQRYELKRIPFVELVSFFEKISEQEKVKISQTALEMIAKEAEGSVRDGLSLLDQVFSFGGNEVKDEDVTQVLGLVDRSIFGAIARAILESDLGTALKFLDDSFTAGIDLKRFMNDLLLYFRALLIIKTSANPEELLDLADLEFRAMKDLAANHEAETLYQHFYLLLKGVEEMHYSQHPRMVLEMTFIKATRAGQIVPVSTLLEKVDALLSGRGISAEEPEAAAAPVPEKKTAVIQSERQGSPPEPIVEPLKTIVSHEDVSLSPDDVPEENSEDEDDLQEFEEITPEQITPVAVHVQKKDIRANWDGFIDYVMDRKKWMAHVLRLCSSAREEGSDLILKYDERTDCKVLQEPENFKLLTEFAQDFFQNEFSVKINVRGNSLDAEKETDGPQEGRRALANDPMVQMTTEIFGGQVVGIRTGPRSR
ncbi:MAG: DNA polymerase III subunit gamma/tau [Proteobacteria bacterium]|nr:DNA polymerase III subunit gamma/tau [Pseudomonadota bacterium]MBU1709472.1 DNA polymerase III subunit gamma/tau [Pseudomonadota bacterium]